MTPRDVEDLAMHWTAAQPLVGAFLRTLVRDPHQSQDLLQQVAVVIVRKFAEYDRARPFAAWAIGIAKQEVLAHRRRTKTSRLVFDDALVDRLALTYQDSVAENIADMRKALEQCVDKLRGRARQAIDFHYSRGMKTSQIAEELGLGHGAVRMLLSRTRDVLRTCVERSLERSLLEP